MIAAQQHQMEGRFANDDSHRFDHLGQRNIEQGGNVFAFGFAGGGYFFHGRNGGTARLCRCQCFSEFYVGCEIGGRAKGDGVFT